MPTARSGKVRAVRTSSMRGVPSATSAPEDWVLGALVIARRAVMADDLEHVPSIKGIADIFTRMLKQLQGMTKNKDDFYALTNEIGSLIEMVVQHAREHKPVSERYKRLCDDFLSTMSDMQTEMEQMFRKRSTKAKAHQTIISSYQFNVRSLRIDIQALTLPSPLKSTGILSNARNTTITGSTFTDIGGNQYIFHGHVTADILGHNSAEQASTGRIDDLGCSDYRNIKYYGDLRAIGVPSRRYRSIRPDDGRERDVVEECTVSYQNQIVTARTYRGKSAWKSFKDDVEVILEYNFLHPHILQLFGICSSRKVPTLVFHGDLKDLNQLDSIGMNPESRDELCQLFQIYEECQAAFRYLMREHHIHDSACDFLTRDGQFIDDGFRKEVGALPISEINFSKCSCRLYVDSSQRLQVSVQAPLITQKPGFSSFFQLPKLSCHDVEAIKIAFVSRRTIPNSHHIDKKACLLAIYDFIIAEEGIPFDHLVVQESPFILISPMRYVRAAQLTFDRECRFTWSGWNLSCWTGRDVILPEPSYITVGNISWTCYKIPHKASIERIHANICCSSSFDASPLYLMAWLAQSERIMSQIKLKCSSFSEYVMKLVKCVERNIVFQSCFSTPSSFHAPNAVYLFVQDLQDVDDVLEIPWFWAKDSKGLQRLSPTDMLVLGLDEPRQSKIFLGSRNAALGSWQDPRIFHEMFGFAPDSPDIPRFLDLPFASVEWDGDDNGPLTPWELLVWNYDDYKKERDHFLDT